LPGLASLILRNWVYITVVAASGARGGQNYVSKARGISAMNIVVIDDSPVMIDVVSMVLDGMGHTVMSFSSGSEAILQIPDLDLDLIISDVHMPELNGLDLTRHLRDTDRHAATPVLLLTGDATPEFEDRCRQAGVTAWLKKPFKPDDLERQVRRLSFD
jgi:two-component system, chemotaxis family, chemotaxis protein CheY